MRNHLDLLIQHEVGQSSWFGFSLVIRPESDRTRSSLISALTEHGFECRPIVAGNFAKNEVIKYFNYEIYGQLKNAEHIDQFGLFVGNHHYPIKEAIDILKSI
jgi:CDP-6-deoxy-D-xylo-4-hexulose-3-dehydrase